MWLGALAHPPQAQLDGFKTRALRAGPPAQRHLYVTEWRSLEQAGGEAGGTVLLLGDDASSVPRRQGTLHAAASWAAVVGMVTTQRGRVSLCALDAVLALVQMQSVTAGSAPTVWLLSVCMQSERSPDGAGAWGLARSARLEASLPLLCIDGTVAKAMALCPSLAEPEVVLHRIPPLIARLAHAPSIGQSEASATRGSHLITGGSGGLGLLTARWLAQRGARNLVLASRGGALARVTATEWRQIQVTSVATLLHCCDTAEAVHVRQLVVLALGAAGTTGVWHAAGVLADGLLSRQDATTCARVYAPKAHGAWALQRAYVAAPVRVCAFFSSVMALLGGAGQANYAAANICLDVLAVHRRAQAQMAVSVQWGAWAEVGMASRGAASKRISAIGFGRIALAQGLGALHTAVLQRGPPCLGAVQVVWSRFVGRAGVPAFLSGVVMAVPSRLCMTTVVERGSGMTSLEAVLATVRQTAGGTVDADAPLMEAGVDSLGAVELRNQLQRAVGEGVTLSSTLIFDHPTARQVALYLQGHQHGVAGVAWNDPALIAVGQVDIAALSVSLSAGVARVDELRAASHCGCDLLCEVPLSRWDVAQATLDLRGSPSEVSSRVRHGGFLLGAELFEHSFFSVSLAEASAMDPQQRQLLECGYAALRAAGMDRASLLGATIAVNVGQWASEFGNVLLRLPAGRSVYASTGFSCSVTCGRVSFVLGLQGQCVSFDTACSASLVANHSSMRALQRCECSAALSAGVNMILDPAAMRINAVAGFTSIRGRSHTFDARADGYARGEAIEAVVCLPGREDSTHSQLVGSAVRQDGRSANLTAPNGKAQQNLLAVSLADAQVAPEMTAVLEAHGTGTALGDPIEAGAVAAVLLVEHSGDHALVIGSLKANAGHTEPGAGLAGVLKLLAQLREGTASPNAQLRVLNPHVGASWHRHATSAALPTQVGTVGASMNGGVSSFGYSGTIAHVVMRHSGSVVGVGTPARQLVPFRRRRSFIWRDAPPHPFAQRMLPSSDGATVFRSPAAGALHALVADHVVQGRIIFPGTGYLEMARAATAGAALHGIYFMQPLTVEVVRLLVECVVAQDRFKVRSGEDDAALAADAAVHCTGAFSAGSVCRHVDNAMARARDCTLVAHVGGLYDSFDRVERQYGPEYRTLVQAWCGENEAEAALKVRMVSTSTVVHPADLDDALCTSELIGSVSGRETKLPFAVDDALLQGAPGRLWAVRVASSHHTAHTLKSI